MTYHEMIHNYNALVQELKNEPQCRCIRLRVLYEKLREFESELEDRYKDYIKSENNDRSYIERAIIADPIPRLINDMKHCKMSIRCMDVKDNKNNKITEDMILNARNYPIIALLEVKKNFASCPNHVDKHPSFYVKDNFG